MLSRACPALAGLLALARSLEFSECSDPPAIARPALLPSGARRTGYERAGKALLMDVLGSLKSHRIKAGGPDESTSGTNVESLQGPEISSLVFDPKGSPLELLSDPSTHAYLDLLSF